jgi:small subunit ribosomal protein S17
MNNKKEEKKAKRYMEGIVVSDKVDKTVVVAFDTLKAHSKYLKKYLSTKRYKAHDPENRFKIGDKLKIMEIRPISKDKKWKVIYDEQGTADSEQ